MTYNFIKTGLNPYIKHTDTKLSQSPKTLQYKAGLANEMNNVNGNYKSMNFSNYR